MSRSRKKTPISGITGARSNKRFKQHEHRRERRRVRTEIASDRLDRLPHPKQYGNEWSSPRDGKCWFGDMKYGRSAYVPFIPAWLYIKEKQDNIRHYHESMRK